MKSINPFITCNSNADAMIEFYQDVFNAELLSLSRFEGVPNADDGSVLNAKILIKDMEFLFMDMKTEYFVPYTHSTSFLIECDNEEEFYLFYDKLKVDGTTMMGPEPIMMWKLVTWVTDKYGVTWQLVTE